MAQRDGSRALDGKNPRRAGFRVCRTSASPDERVWVKIEVARPDQRASADRHLAEAVLVGAERLEDRPPQERAQVTLNNVAVGEREPDPIVGKHCRLADAKHGGIHRT